MFTKRRSLLLYNQQILWFQLRKTEDTPFSYKLNSIISREIKFSVYKQNVRSDNSDSKILI